ncbi:MAG TPA: anthranilate phosphoribosyltransferase [Terriglobia bacterium]|nr:anthranilate phosphoribosyltransferase [Terriglobia bacterium]
MRTMQAGAIQRVGARSFLNTMQIHEAAEKLMRGESLERQEAHAVMDELLSGRAPDEHIAALLLALRDKGETTAELVGFAEVMRSQARQVLADAGVRVEDFVDSQALLDTCGTGGDRRGTANVSTATALVVAGCGVPVAKHGNRSISSRCGSADVLEAIGVAIDLPLRHIPACLDEAGMVFLFAPHLHLAMKHVMGARRSIKGKTIFNLLGPVTNPLEARHQLTGVYHEARTEMMAEALGMVGTRRAIVVAGSDGLDEITIAGPTKLSEYNSGRIETRRVLPEDFGLPRAAAETLAGGDPEQNAKLLIQILDGEKNPLRDCILANSAAALVAAGKAPDFREGVAAAAESIDSGEAKRTLRALVEFTGKHRR